MVGAALALGGAGALFWGAAGLLTAPSSRRLGPTRAVLWLGVAGVSVGAVLALAGGPLRVRDEELPAILGAGAFLLVATQVWSIIAGRGKISLAAPIVACDGAVAALAAVLAGHRLPFVAYAGLTLMVAGLVVLSAPDRAEVAEVEDRGSSRDLSRRTTVVLAVVAAAGYGGMLFCAGTVEGTSPLWTVTIARALATVVALGICVRQRQVLPTRDGVGFAVGAGIADLAAFTLFVEGAQHDPAISAVAVSQYGAVATLAAVVFLRERLTPRQTAAVAVLAIGAGVVATAG